MNEKGVNMLRYESYSMLKIRFIEPRRQKVWFDMYNFKGHNTVYMR